MSTAMKELHEIQMSCKETAAYVRGYLDGKNQVLKEWAHVESMKPHEKTGCHMANLLKLFVK
jgi:hypothetical protein